VPGPVRTKYALHKARLVLRIVVTAIASLAFILDVVGGATYSSDHSYYYYDYYSWPIAGSVMVSNPPYQKYVKGTLTDGSRYPSP
jgi:hypothetical protein